MVPSLFALASQHLDWLSARQAIVARNVANANTPGYLAQDVRPFSSVLDSVAVKLVTTNPAHLPSDMSEAGVVRTVAGESWEITHSGNSVALEQEMIKAGDIHRSYALDTAVMRSFYQMLNMATKG